MRHVWFVLAALMLSAAAGCDDDLPRASEIEHMRVLGAKSEVVGDPSRSNPKPGESAQLTWDMAYPDLMQDDSQLRSAFISCTAPERFTGVPVCQEVLDAASSGSNLQLWTALGGQAPDCAKTPDVEQVGASLTVTCVSGQPKSVIPIGRDFRAAAKLVQGVICKQGIPALTMSNPAGVGCRPLPGVDPDDVESIPVYGTIQVERSPADANHNPSADAIRVAFGESEIPWQALTAEQTSELNDDCSEAARRRDIPSTNGKDEQIVIGYDAGAREKFDGEAETLEFSTYVTWGELSRRFTVFGPNAEVPLRSDLEWNVDQELRDELGDRSRLVRFYFTLLDRRGGYAVTSRALCVGRDLTRAN